MLAIQNRDRVAAQAALERDASQATDPLPGGLSPLLFALYNGAPDIAAVLAGFRPLDLFEAAASDDARRVAELVFADPAALQSRSEEHTSELQSLMRISYAVFCLKKKNR